MTILVTGATGSIGTQVLAHLANKGAEVHALVRKAENKPLPDGVTPVTGDMTDVDSMRAALAKTSTLFLLNAVVADEVTQALITLNLARDAGIDRIVYFSVLHSDLYTNVPHFTGKFTVERMLEQFDIAATILRPAYFMQNDVQMRDALLKAGIYPMPVGGVGVAMLDTRDIGEIAALELLRREGATGVLPREVINLAGPDRLTGSAVAAIWTEALGRPIRYAGDDVAAFEQQMRANAPSWMAYDMRLMLARFQRDGMVASPEDLDRLTALLGRPLRSYRGFAAEMAEQWMETGK